MRIQLVATLEGKVAMRLRDAAVRLRSGWVGGVVEIERTDERVQGRCSWETRVKDNEANIGCMRVVSID